MWEYRVCVCLPKFLSTVYWRRLVGASVRVRERGWFCPARGNTLSPPPSPLLPPSFFPSLPSSLQQLFSCLSWELEPGCFPSRHKQELTELTDTHTLFLSVSAPSHTRLADCVLTSFRTWDRGASIPPLLLCCRLCSFTFLCERDCSGKCFHGETPLLFSQATLVAVLSWVSFPSKTLLDLFTAGSFKKYLLQHSSEVSNQYWNTS